MEISHQTGERPFEKNSVYMSNGKIARSASVSEGKE